MYWDNQLDISGLQNRAPDQSTDRNVVDRDSSQDEVCLAMHSLAASSVVDSLDPLHCVANHYLRRLIPDEQVFIQMLAKHRDSISATGLGLRNAELPVRWRRP